MTLISTGDNYVIHLRNFGRVGSNAFELVVVNEPQIERKIALGKSKRKDRDSPVDSETNVLVFPKPNIDGIEDEII